LYASKNEFDTTEAGYKNTGEKTSGSGKGYECDGANSPSCKNGDIITLNSGHVFERQVINSKRSYQCTTSGPDKWVIYNGGDCSYRDDYLTVGDEFINTVSKTECSGITLTDDKGTEFKIVCLAGPTLLCKAVKCEAGFTADSAGKCVPATVDCMYDGKPYRKGAHNPEPCKHMVGKDNVAYAIQECLDGGKWSACQVTSCVGSKLPDKDGKCPGGGGVTPPSAKKCTEGGKSFNPGAPTECAADKVAAAGAVSATKVCQSNGTWSDCSFVCPDGQGYQKDAGKCVAGATPTPPAPLIFDCNSTADMAYVSEMQVKYANNKTVTDFINKILAFCASDTRNEAEFNNLIAQLKILIGRIEGDIKKDRDASGAKIQSALSQISTMRASYESNASVWKTGEGKFNTSRLVSDSVAGVVLGTAGGLITSSVIKKNQIKGGFEDISCTIGGQVVADWGDEFNVGIR
jgi:hypothetical protein